MSNRRRRPNVGGVGTAFLLGPIVGALVGLALFGDAGGMPGAIVGFILALLILADALHMF
jgi:hypothetical protein